MKRSDLSVYFTSPVYNNDGCPYRTHESIFYMITDETYRQFSSETLLWGSIQEIMDILNLYNKFVGDGDTEVEILPILLQWTECTNRPPNLLNYKHTPRCVKNLFSWYTNDKNNGLHHGLLKK